MMNSNSVPFLKLLPIREEVKTAIDNVLHKGIFINGSYFEVFKTDFAKYLKLEHVIPTANCTDALEIILRSIDIRKNDEVITSAFSWYSDASVVKVVGAKLVFCDVDLDHFGIQLSELKNRITPNTKALILPHLFGVVHPDIEEIVSICSKHKIILIEDCAQAHGATLNGEMAGSFGDIAAFSFYPTKNLGALGDAGAIATNHKALADKCQLWSNYGLRNRNEHIQLGRNSRMDEMQAAILTAKLPFLDSDNEKRQKLAAIYFARLSGLECKLPMKTNGHVFHQFVIRTERREELQNFLLSKGVETDIHYPKALSDMEIFETKEEFPNAVLASKTVLSLPIYPNHTFDDIEYAADMIYEFFRG